MRRAQRTDLFREMKKSFNRYISILLIMALGVAFYAGVRSAEPDMQLSAKDFYDSTSYMDIRVLGTLGMTESDVEEIGKIEGIACTEGGYQAELFLEAGERDYQMNVYSLGDNINHVHLLEGRLPENAKECFMDNEFMAKMGYQLGDVITLHTEEDKELSDTLAEDTFTIVGAGSFPMYLSWNRGSVSIGTGVEDGFLFVPKSAFSMEVFTAVYALMENAKELNPYEEEYEELSESIVEKIEAIAGERCDIRYAEVTDPYWEDIYEAEAEIADGEKELADGEQKLLDAEKELAEAEVEIADAEKKIADGEKEIADGEVKLADAAKEIEDGEKQIADAEAELADAAKEIEDGEKQIADAEVELAEAAKEIEDGEKQIADAEKELADAAKELADGEQQIAENETLLTETKERLAMGRMELETGKAQLATQEEEFNQAKAALEAYGMPLTPELLAAQTQLEEAKQMLAGKEAELVGGEAQVAAGEAELAAAKEQLDSGKKQYEEGLSELETAKAELADGKTKYEDGLAELETAKAELADGKKQYEEGLSELENAKAELADGKKKYEDGKAELADARQELESGKKELEDGRKKLADAKVEIEEAKVELADGRKELEDGKAELADAKADLEEVEVPEWIVLDRSKDMQFVEYGMNSERIGNLGDVFPAVFYLVAALVSLTTMTRMIEEERTQIGTMKALGYSKGAIVSKYVWYSLSATLLGGVIGVLVGSYFFPWVIINAYGILYSNIPNIISPIQWELSLISVLIAVGCTLLATLSSCYKEMMAAPAILMRPVAPAAGKRVFLEYIKPLWNHMNFSWKATCRNLFRYKKRFFMTIFGIGGCMALLLVGFGLRDSIMEIVNNQYKKIWTYDAYLSVNDTALNLTEDAETEKIEDSMYIQSIALDVESETALKSVTLFVPERISGLEEFLKLQDRVTGEKYVLEEHGVIVSEKLANMLDVKVGDVISLHIDDIAKKPVEITAVAENYMANYVYMSTAQYEALFEEPADYNQLYLKLADMTKEEEGNFSSAMLSHEEVDSVTYVHELQESVATMMRALELVVVVLIVAAGMLAFIVLYNLNNINIIERRRELATLKVLGFYDVEVGSYVYRENVLLTLFGILAGVVMGFFLHRYVILTVEVDMIMFGREIEFPSYIYSIILTCVFALLINFGMLFKLKKIDMVESLKSAE